jgi:hypothetical protein
MITHESSSYQAFHSSYKKTRSEFPISATTKNLFLSLSESIAQTLMQLHVMFVEDEHERPLAVGGKGAKPTGAL